MVPGCAFRPALCCPHQSSVSQESTDKPGADGCSRAAPVCDARTACGHTAWHKRKVCGLSADHAAGCCLRRVLGSGRDRWTASSRARWRRRWRCWRPHRRTWLRRPWSPPRRPWRPPRRPTRPQYSRPSGSPPGTSLPASPKTPSTYRCALWPLSSAAFLRPGTTQRHHRPCHVACISEIQAVAPRC